MIELLETATEKISGLVTKERSAETYLLLNDCQEAAIALGGHIEKIYGMQTQTVSELEGYYENLYSLSIALNDMQNVEHEIDKLYKSIHRVKHIYTEELEKIIDVVFIPYKVAMWDSMSSVYTAMKDDSRFRVVVVPISYYDMNEDGSYGEFHYELDMYPTDVALIKSDEYNFEEIRPDIIFTHNPYDDYNRVTRVDSFFFSRNIKNYTDNLVYIPYFITGGYMSEGFNYLPSYMNMDYIITQSEVMKQFYHSEFHKKLLPLGSPKSDSILAPIDHKLLPEEWKKKIKGKKVFLYNTSISSLLQDTEEFLEKIRYVIACFENRENVVLIWRPHPLLLSTIKSMRPAFESDYIKIVKSFKYMGNGIFDDGIDLSTVVKLSDAYVGESSSSMVCLFGILGKPIFLTNPDIKVDSLREEKNKYAYDYVEIGQDKWVLSGMGNELYQIAEDEKIEQYSIPNERVDGVRLYNKMLLCGNLLVLIPYTAREIAIFDIETKQFEKIEYLNCEDVKLVNAVYKDNFVWMFPAIGDYLLKLNLETKKITYITQAVPKLRWKSQESPRFFNTVVLEDNKIFAASAQSNQVLVIDVDTSKFEVFEVGEDGDNYWSMEYDGKDFWLASNEKCFITRWNYRTKEWEKHTDFPSSFTGESLCFIQLVYASGYIYALPKSSNAILKIDIATEQIEVCDMKLAYKEGERKNTFYNWPSNYYFAKKTNENRIATMTAYDHSLLLLDIENELHEDYKIPMQISEVEFYERFRRESDNIPLACRETRSATLPQFIEVATKEFRLCEEEIRLYAEVINNMDGTCGEKIKEFFLKKLG